MRRTWLIVVNANAGRRGSPTAVVRNEVHKTGLDAVVVETKTLAELNDAVEGAVTRGVTSFASVGGDGSAHHLLNAMRSHAEPSHRQLLAIVPAGSGSDFARMFGQRQDDIPAALSRMAEPEIYPIDIGHVRGDFGSRYFLNGLDVGVVAASAERAESLPRWLGGFKYTTAF